MVSKSKSRDSLDQFYTCLDTSKMCIDLFFKEIKPNKNDIYLEPSAGTGSFSDFFLTNNYQVYAYDIDPKKPYIVKQDFLEVDNSIFDNLGKIHCIGNPPFGRQSCLARKFIKKISSFSETIAFILPKSFRKESYMKSFPLNFHLIKEIDLPKNSFTIDDKQHNVPCIFQIWHKKNYNRKIPDKHIEKGFSFIKKPETKVTKYNTQGKIISKENIFIEHPDFAILRAGGGKTCGRISLNYNDGIKCYPEAWLFIKLDSGLDKDVFYSEYKKIDWSSDSNVGARSISKQVFIQQINKLIEKLTN